MEPVLSAEDLAFFRENGYVLVRNVVPKETVDAVVDAIFEFLDMDKNNPDDWYREPLNPNGMVEMYQHQAMWDTRQHPRVHAAFAAIHGTEKLWVTMDRVSLKPPRHPDHPKYDHKGFIHWDVDTSLDPIPFGVQGVLYLADTDENQGGFQCVPSIFRDFDAYIASQPADRNPTVPDITGHEIVKIPGKAGDLVIWDTRLPHGNGHNVSDKPRLAQYISMSPAPANPGKAREHRIRMWRERLHPGPHPAFPGDPRRIEQLYGKTAELTPLGRKLLGLDLWDDDATSAAG